MQSVVVPRQSTLRRRSFAASFLPGRFDWLMGLYAENHKRLARLFAPERVTVGDYVSSVGDGLAGSTLTQNSWRPSGSST